MAPICVNRKGSYLTDYEAGCSGRPQDKHQLISASSSQPQSFTCVERSLIEMVEGDLYIYFESMEDTATFLETWIFLVDQTASNNEPEAAADPRPVQHRLVKGLSHATLLALKQYLARFGSGGYLVAEDGDGLSFVFVNPQDAVLMRQQFAGAFQRTPQFQEAAS